MRRALTSSMNAAGSGCTAPIAASLLRQSPISPITASSSAITKSPGLEVTEFYDPPDTNDPQAMHLAVVIVDPDTGAVSCARFTARTIVA